MHFYDVICGYIYIAPSELQCLIFGPWFIYLLFALQVSLLLGEEKRNWNGFCSIYIVRKRMAGDLFTALATMGEIPGLSTTGEGGLVTLQGFRWSSFQTSLLGSTVLRYNFGISQFLSPRSYLNRRDFWGMTGHGVQWVILLRGLSSVGVLRLWWSFQSFLVNNFPSSSQVSPVSWERCWRKIPGLLAVCRDGAGTLQTGQLSSWSYGSGSWFCDD